LLEEHGTYVGRGRWFDQDERYFRLGFAWPAEAELTRGLEGLDRAAAGSIMLGR
jgi:DNA-binding transcriptional MocR family regulator